MVLQNFLLEIFYYSKNWLILIIFLPKKIERAGIFYLPDRFGCAERMSKI